MRACVCNRIEEREFTYKEEIFEQAYLKTLPLQYLSRVVQVQGQTTFASAPHRNENIASLIFANVSTRTASRSTEREIVLPSVLKAHTASKLSATTKSNHLFIIQVCKYTNPSVNRCGTLQYRRQ